MVPNVGGEKAFELLRMSMMDGRKVAIAKTILVSKEILASLLPTQNGIIMRSLYYADDIKEAPPYAKSEMSSDEILAISQLVDSMTKKFEHAFFHDEYALQIKALVDKKIETHDVVKVNEEVPQLPVLEAIRESIIKANPTGNKPRKSKEKDVSKSKADFDPAPHSSQK
jgi:DNA end-binding protein Ku